MTTNTFTAFLLSDDEDSDPDEYFTMTTDDETAAFLAFEDMIGDDFDVDSTDLHYEQLFDVDPDPAVRVYRVSDLAVLYIAPVA